MQNALNTSSIDTSSRHDLLIDGGPTISGMTLTWMKISAVSLRGSKALSSTMTSSLKLPMIILWRSSCVIVKAVIRPAISLKYSVEIVSFPGDSHRSDIHNDSDL